MRNLGYALLALCATASAFTSAPHTHPALRRFLSAGQGEVETPSTDSPASSPKRLFVFGLGYVGKELALALTREENGDFYVSGTCTNIQKIEALRQAGVESYLFDAESGRMFQKEAIDDLMNATHVLCTVPPLESDLDPVIQLHGADIKRAAMGGKLEWLGYLSSTGVYGDRDGAWVTEEDVPRPNNKKTKSRHMAENAWSALKERVGLPVHIFRLAGIYGPGRSALDTLIKAGGDMRQCGAYDHTFISRVHVEDIVSVLRASMASPSPGLLVNVADDLPATRYDVLSFACRLLKYPISAPDSTADEGRVIRGGSKRVDNTRMRALLARTGAEIKHSDYRSGLEAIFYGDYFRDEESAKEPEASEDSDMDEDRGAKIVDRKRAKFSMNELKERFGAVMDDQPVKSTEVTSRLSLLEAQVLALADSNKDLKVAIESLTKVLTSAADKR